MNTKGSLYGDEVRTQQSKTSGVWWRLRVNDDTLIFFISIGRDQEDHALICSHL